jgi:N-acetylneuraminic acid mutarotase
MLSAMRFCFGGGRWDFRRHRLILAFSVLLLPGALAQSGPWAKKHDLPTPRSGASACVVDGKIYVIGGSGAGNVDMATIEAYDPVTDTWEAKAPMPTPRGFLSTAVVNDTIYAIGGGYPTSKNKVEAYDPVTNTWKEKPDMLSPRLGAQAAVVDGIIYNIGGNYNQRNCEAYDPSTNTWTAKAPIPESEGVLSVTVYNGLIYAFGGSTYSPWAALSTVYAYNVLTDAWTKKTNMPTSRFAFQTYLLDGKIYAIGGAPATSGALASVEVYDPVNDTWETRPDMPKRLAWFAGTAVNGKIYVIGGTQDWSVSVSEVWEYDPAFHTDVAAGNVSGSWTLANSPYHINGEITIPNGESLAIEPGVEVVFMGHYKFNVQGRLLAIGTEKDSIRFTAADAQTGWHGIRFIGTPNTNDTSKIVYSELKHGKANTGSGLDRSGGAMLITGFDKVVVSNCLFHSNMNNGDMGTTGGPAICVESASPIITNSTFTGNTGTTDCAIICWRKSKAIISNNVFSNNRGQHGPILCVNYYLDSPTISGNVICDNVTTWAGGGIFIYMSTARIENNIIIRNQSVEGGGIKCWVGGNPICINNTIAYNSGVYGGGICCNENCDPIFINNVVWGNTGTDGSQVCLLDTQSDPMFGYCDIQGGKDGFGGSGAGVNYSGRYENNIIDDPMFMDTASDDFRLSNSSPCIGMGIDSLENAGIWYYVPPFCIGGNPRPSPAGSKPDIGACENPTPTGVDERPNSEPRNYALDQNFPNPFNPSTTIKYELPQSSVVRLSVYDILGREVSVLVNDRREAGVHEVTFDGSNLSSGVYLYRLQAGTFVEAKKLSVLR